MESEGAVAQQENPRKDIAEVMLVTLSTRGFTLGSRAAGITARMLPWRGAAHRGIAVTRTGRSPRLRSGAAVAPNRCNEINLDV